jgi:hypothetical protein|tara:strand:+ start:5005 stop:5145 length:141 start_codon:yes stop_codon:yes gene_type:complete
MQDKATALDQSFQLEMIILLGDKSTDDNLMLPQYSKNGEFCQLIEE